MKAPSLLVLALMLVSPACARHQAKTAQTKEAPSSTFVTPDEEGHSIVGHYTCQFGEGAELQSAPCEITQGASSLELRMELGTFHLQGTAEAQSFGFHLSGSLNDESVQIDVMRQGQGHYAAVLQSADKKLYRLNMAPDLAANKDW